MKPTLAAEELRRNLTHYLTTTFALADEPVRDGLERFPNHPTQGIFRGPYLRIRTPFKEAPDGWRRGSAEPSNGLHEGSLACETYPSVPSNLASGKTDGPVRLTHGFVVARGSCGGRMLWPTGR
jgi:hypothetical protein